MCVADGETKSLVVIRGLHSQGNILASGDVWEDAAKGVHVDNRGLNEARCLQERYVHYLATKDAFAVSHAESTG